LAKGPSNRAAYAFHVNFNCSTTHNYNVSYYE
jgi:hypothetical protein